MSASVPNAKVAPSFRFASGLRQYDQKSPSNPQTIRQYDQSISGMGSSVVAPSSPQLTPRMALQSREPTQQQINPLNPTPRRAVILSKAEPPRQETVRPASPMASPRDLQYRDLQFRSGSPLVTFSSRAVRQQSLPTTTSNIQGAMPFVNLATTRQASQPPLPTDYGRMGQVTPEPNYREVITGPIIYDGGRHAVQPQSLQFVEGRGGHMIAEAVLSDSPYENFNSEIELLAPAPAGSSVTLEDMNIAIQGVMQAIEEERAMRANEISDLRREVYQVIHTERETHSREFNDLKSEVSTQHGWFMKEIIRRSVYEARLQNEVDQICKDPQEVSDRFKAVDDQLNALRAAMEPLRAATEMVFAQSQTVAKQELGPEVLNDPRLVELLVASTDSSIRVIQDQIHDLVGQKIEEHLGKIDDASSLFGMVREALSSSRHLKDEMDQVKEVLGPIPSMPLLEALSSPARESPGQYAAQQLDAYGRSPYKIKRREGNGL